MNTTRVNARPKTVDWDRSLLIFLILIDKNIHVPLFCSQAIWILNHKILNVSY